MYRIHHCGRNVRIQRGVGLVEVLIAVLVLAIGFLGLAGLQTRGLKAAQSSYERSIATVQAYSILDAMRSNALRSEDPAVQLARAHAYVHTSWVCAIPAVPTASSTLAEKDFYNWIQNLKTTIRGDVCARIKEISNTSLEYRVEVCWGDLSGGSDTDTGNCLGGLSATTLTLQSRL